MSAAPDSGRDETPLERADRNLVELLQEVRVVQTGVQVLFAFLLTAPLAQRFPQVDAFQKAAYFVSLASAGAAAMLLIAPTSYHRILFRAGDKEHLVMTANRFTLAGLVFLGIAMIGALVFITDLLFPPAVTAATGAVATTVCVWCWAAAPLRRRARVRGRARR